jgi:hypothetical protein
VRDDVVVPDDDLFDLSVKALEGRHEFLHPGFLHDQRSPLPKLAAEDGGHAAIIRRFAMPTMHLDRKCKVVANQGLGSVGTSPSSARE